ncbi:hypothetical protein HMPREF1152_1833 [Mogibacterium sp. CM50]|nr:hypothetical protein HMPREF1152_1833 [Mogibacterium sp. CM50]
MHSQYTNDAQVVRAYSCLQVYNKGEYLKIAGGRYEGCHWM